MPTPDMAVAFWMNQDARDWQMKYLDGNRHGILCEFGLKGESIKHWKEMVAQQIVFTRKPLREYYDAWKAELVKVDPNSRIGDVTEQDGSIVATYSSPLADETSIRRFMQGSDGVYMLAYLVRPKLKNERKFELWETIITEATLIPNPEKM